MQEYDADKYITGIYKVTFLYVFVASIWIIFSDQLLGLIVSDIELYARLQTYKGWVFVLVTGSLFYIYLKPRSEALKKYKDSLLDSKVELSKNEEKYRELVNGMVDPIWVIDIEGHIIDVNDTAVEVLGYSRNELLSMGLQDTGVLFKNKDIKGLIETIKQNDDLKFETQHVSKSGQIIPVEINSTLIRYMGKTAILCASRDITERKVMELELQQSEEDYRRLFEDHTAIKILIDPRNGNIVEANNSAALYYGWTRDELREMSIQDINILPPELVAKEIQKVKGLKSVHFEFKHRLADGSIRDVEVFSCPTKMKGKELIHSIIHDITDRKNTEIELLESERKFRNYIENAPDGILIIDENGIVLEVNNTICSLTGYSQDELVMMNIKDIISPQSLIREEKSFAELKNNGYTSVEISIVRKDGVISWLRKDATRLSAKRYLVFTIDITDKKKTEQYLIEAKIIAEGSNRTKSEFLANMSHELRTPLTSIIGFSDLLDNKIFGELNDKQLGFVRHIHESGKHLLELINDVLDLSKIEAGKMELDLDTFLLRDMIEEVKATMSPMAKKNNIDFEIIDKIKNEKILADRTKMKQILFNLLSNALKFTNEGGKISTTVKNDDNRLVISVSDTGLGIPSDMKEDIFNAFIQVDASNRRKYGGTGLGLTLVKKYVKMHNGKIWVQSAEGKGSTFTFTIENVMNKKNQLRSDCHSV